MKPVVIKVPKAHLLKDSNPIFRNMGVIKELKDAGVPVVGHTVVEGVSRGVLTLSCDEDNFLYVWVDKPVPVKPQPVATTIDDEDDEL